MPASPIGPFPASLRSLFSVCATDGGRTSPSIHAGFGLGVRTGLRICAGDAEGRQSCLSSPLFLVKISTGTGGQFEAGVNMPLLIECYGRQSMGCRLKLLFLSPSSMLASRIQRAEVPAFYGLPHID